MSSVKRSLRHAAAARGGDDPHHVPNPRRPLPHGQRRPPKRQTHKPQSLRRGRGGLAGDASSAPSLRARGQRHRRRLPARIVRAIWELARVIDTEGLGGRQVVDIPIGRSGCGEVGIKRLEYIHLHKTAAVVGGSVVMGR
ncbi:hypothetical protein Scep_003650 [Stephania cephalantha]|uniref:Uncharacterized protein n=1 Tax=Stephania cephalantha TaxID=152367 RepID=A0AAP0PY93_9MAGN